MFVDITHAIAMRQLKGLVPSQLYPWNEEMASCPAFLPQILFYYNNVPPRAAAGLSPTKTACLAPE